MIAKLTTYKYRALVVYNPAAAAANAVVLAGLQPGQHPRLLVGQQQLALFSHGRPTNAVLALTGQDVDFVLGAIQPQQIGQHRPSYINAILIQSRGQAASAACTQCRGGPGLRPFPKCRSVRGHFGGACANCKWRDHGLRCSLHRESPGDDESGDEGEDERRSRSPRGDAGRTAGRRRLGGPRLGERGLLGAGTQQDPIVL